VDETDTDLAAVKRMAQEALDLGQDTRNRSTTAVQYYHKKQLSSDELEALRLRKQPDIVINRIRPAVNGTLGVLQQGQTDPKAWPRTPNDEDSADVATKTLRYIADYNEFHSIRIAAARDYLIQHACAVIVGADDKHRVTIECIAPEEFLFDARSRSEDFSDARYMGVAKWMYADDVAGLYPDQKDDIFNAIESTAAITVDASLQDKPSRNAGWIDSRRRRMLVVELYYKERGKWLRAVFHACGILESGPSSYKDTDGKPCCPIVAQSCYVDDELIRYGIVYDMLDLQDEINKRRSKALHLLNSRQARVSPYYAGDPDRARQELARPDGVLIGEQGEIEVFNNSDVTAGNLQMLQEIKSEMERAGPNPAILGRQSADASGRAVLARQQAGLVELAVVFAGHEAWERRVYRQCWSTAKQYMQAPDYIRITDDEGSPKFIGINQPVQGPPQVGIHPETGMPMIQPTILGYENALAEMDVDITLDTVPDTATIAQEQFQTLVELAKMYGPQEVPFDDMLMLSAIPDKSKIIERRKARQEEQSQGQGPQQQIALEGAVAQIDETKSKTALNMARVQQIHVDAVSSAFSAGAQSAGYPAAGG
jgi:hypothetical protein